MDKITNNIPSNNGLLKSLFQSFSNGLRNFKATVPREYLASIGLDNSKLEIGFNSSQWHHRKDEVWRKPYIDLGLLTLSDAPVNDPSRTAYTCFGAYSLVFPLKNQQGEIVNLFMHRFKLNVPAGAFLNQEGIYPNYPKPLTKRLFITRNVIDTATLLQSGLLENRDSVMSLFDGELLKHQVKAIAELEDLEQIILIDGSMIGFQNDLQAQFPGLQVRQIALPEEHSLNDMWLNYGLDGVRTLIEEVPESSRENKKVLAPSGQLKKIHDGKLEFQTSSGTYFVVGSLPTDLGNMKVSIHFIERDSNHKHRNKVDLYERERLIKFARTISELEDLDLVDVEQDLTVLTDLLEIERDKELELEFESDEREPKVLTPQKQAQAIDFLSEPNLTKRIDSLIEASGVVGEKSNRMMLFVIASTYKMPITLHSLIQGTSGSGKSHLLNAIASLMPQEDVLNMTRITSQSLYYYQKDELVNKLVLIQDIDGLDDKALYAFREMQSAGNVSTSTIKKDKNGQLVSKIFTVQTHFASLIATTHAEIYFDNMSRSLVVGVDESQEQTLDIIAFQNKKTAGVFDEVLCIQAREQLQNCMRTLKSYEVVNRFADKLQLPVEAKMLRRLNSHYQAFVSQITLLHQFQREEDSQGRLIATVEDLRLACEILFDAIMWKIDELDSSLRQFFEDLKVYLSKKDKGLKETFCSREIRLAFKLSKSQMHRYIDELRQLEYIEVDSGSANKGFKYKISFADDMKSIRDKVKADLLEQIESLNEI
jgi:energy-coupling factor transporter ATP-binding protein EcfA2